MTDRDKDDLLPWVANRTATDAEKQEAEAYLADNSDARDELAFLEKIRDSVKAAGPIASPGELGLARLRRKIADERRTVQPAQTSVRWWQAAAIAATVLVAVQAAFLVDRLGDDAQLTTATGPSVDGPVIQATFVGEAQEAAIRELLLDLGLVIVDGPSAVGVYRLAPGADTGSAEALAALVAELKAQADLVSHAELETPAR